MVDIEKFKDYLMEKGYESEVDFSDVSKFHIKSDLLEFGDYYIIFFSQFCKHFMDFKEAKDLIEKNYPIFTKLLLLKNNRSREINFGRGRALNIFRDYVSENYLTLSEIFDLCVEVYEL